MNESLVQTTYRAESVIASFDRWIGSVLNEVYDRANTLNNFDYFMNDSEFNEF